MKGAEEPPRAAVEMPPTKDSARPEPGNSDEFSAALTLGAMPARAALFLVSKAKAIEQDGAKVATALIQEAAKIDTAAQAAIAELLDGDTESAADIYGICRRFYARRPKAETRAVENHVFAHHPKAANLLELAEKLAAL